MDNGDFEVRYIEAEKSLYLVAVSFLHNTEDARDAVQEAAISALRGYSKLKNKDYFKTWITRILINKCKDFLKAQRYSLELTDSIGAFARIPDEEIEVMDCLCRMDSAEAKYITLRFYGDMTYDEVSGLLRLPVSTVKFRTKRAMEKLRIMLEGDVI